MKSTRKRGRSRRHASGEEELQDQTIKNVPNLLGGKNDPSKENYSGSLQVDVLERTKQRIADKYKNSSQINSPLNFDSSLKVCLEKIDTDLIFNPTDKRPRRGDFGFTSMKDLKQHVTQTSDCGDHVTQSDFNVTSLDENNVTQSLEFGSLEFGVGSIEKDNVTQSSGSDVVMSLDTDNVTQCGATSSDENSVTQSSIGEKMDVDTASSYFYDYPPPSTPAHKKARRAKRRLQLEQWKLYELSRTRSERYQNRMKRQNGSLIMPQSRKTTIKWKNDLVQVFFIE